MKPRRPCCSQLDVSRRPWLRRDTSSSCSLGVCGRHRAALARRHLLVRVEGPDGGMSVRAQRLALVHRAERLARVLDQRDAVLLAEWEQRVVLGRVAEDVDGHERLRARCDRGLDRRRIEIQRARIDIGEHRCRSLVDRAVRGGDERIGRRDHLVAGRHTREPHAEMQPSCPRRHGGAMRRTDGVREQRLEARPGRPERQPARAEDLEHELLVALVDPRRAEVDPVGCRAQLCAS